jgi:hypothetical protein
MTNTGSRGIGAGGARTFAVGAIVGCGRMCEHLIMATVPGTNGRFTTTDGRDWHIAEVHGVYGYTDEEI